MLLVLSPSNSLGVEEVGNGGHIGGNLIEVVVVHAEVVTTGRGAVVGLRRVSSSKVVGQKNALRRKLREVLVSGSGIVVLGSFQQLFIYP